MKFNVKIKKQLRGGKGLHATKAQPVILSTRIRLARNLQKFPFPNWAKKEQKADILSICSDAISKLKSFPEPVCFRTSDLDDFEKKLLLERHYISMELCENDANTGIILGKKRDFAFMVNEEDHLRLQILHNGLDLKKAWKALDALDSELEKYLEYAFSSELGYLTACPTNLGTGMRASAMVHLPGMVLSEQIKPLVRALSEMGMAVRGLFGEKSKASGSIFQISNQCTLGEDENALLERLENVLNSLATKELGVRQRLLENDREVLFDKISRALGVLKTFYKVSLEEAMNLLSFLRLGIDLKIFPEEQNKVVEKLFLRIQPAHLQLYLNKRLKKEEEDTVRADFLRSAIVDFPEPNFKLWD